MFSNPPGEQWGQPSWGAQSSQAAPASSAGAVRAVPAVLAVAASSGQQPQQQQDAAQKEQGKAELSATPTFAELFCAHKKAKVYKATKKKAAKAPPRLDKIRQVLDRRMQKMKRCCSGKRNPQCRFQELRRQDDFIANVCLWRRNWQMSSYSAHADRCPINARIHAVQAVRAVSSVLGVRVARNGRGPRVHLGGPKCHDVAT